VGIELFCGIKNLNRDSVKTWLMTTTLGWPHSWMLFVATNIFCRRTILDQWSVNIEPVIKKFLMSCSGLALQKSDESNHDLAFRVIEFLLQT